MAWRELIARLRPRSYRARIAVAIVVALGVTVFGTEVVLRGALQQQVRDSIRVRLQQQADALALRVERFGVGAVNDVIPLLASDTFIEVRQQGETVRWNGQIHEGDVVVTALQPGDRIEVRLAESPPNSRPSLRIAALVLVGLAIVGGVVWLLSGAVAQRLRRSATDLSRLAEDVAAGDLSARAPPSDDELGRVAAAMNQMAGRLESSDRRQREFLADVAHELRTPVTAIEGFAEALADGTAATEEDRAEAAAFIRDEAARLRDLVRQLQEETWHDLDAPVAWARVDLGALGREAASRFETAAREAGITLTAPTESIPAVSDPAHIETILANLITNAIRVTPAGGRIDVTVGRDPASVWIRVADTGRGIAQEHLPYVFDRLFRVGSARDRESGGGSGLGLAIVRRLAQRLGGRVTVQSALGQGATFTLRLPVRRGAARRPHGAPPAA